MGTRVRYYDGCWINNQNVNASSTVLLPATATPTGLLGQLWVISTFQKFRVRNVMGCVYPGAGAAGFVQYEGAAVTLNLYQDTAGTKQIAQIGLLTPQPPNYTVPQAGIWFSQQGSAEQALIEVDHHVSTTGIVYPSPGPAFFGKPVSLRLQMVGDIKNTDTAAHLWGAFWTAEIELEQAESTRGV